MQRNAALLFFRIVDFSEEFFGTSIALKERIMLMILLSLLASQVMLPTDPPVTEVQQVALHYAHLDPGDSAGWKKRARLAPLLPRFQVDYGRKVQNDIDVDIQDNVYVGAGGTAVGPQEGSFSQNATADQSVGLRAMWQLDELIFNRNQLAASSEVRLRMRDVQALLAEVNKHYYRRRQLQGEIELLRKGKLPVQKGESREHLLLLQRVEFDASTAALDGLTGGWFSRQLREGP